MKKEYYDVVVIGGGINGLGIAREAQKRGLEVCVVEKGDIGAGTSAASTRLIHGGLRYLANIKSLPVDLIESPSLSTLKRGLKGSFDLVEESLAERAFLLKNAPHLVHPLKLMIPTQSERGFQQSRGEAYRKLPLAENPHNKAEVWLGLQFYNRKSEKYDDGLDPSAGITSKEFQKDYKFSLPDNNGGLSYWDAQVALPERLCVENAIDAYGDKDPSKRDKERPAKDGAEIKTHTEAEALLVDFNDDGLPGTRSKLEKDAAKRIAGVEVKDDFSLEPELLLAPIVINAAGSNVDSITSLPQKIRGADGEFRTELSKTNQFAKMMGGTKGTHIVVKWFHGAPEGYGIYVQARKDGRPYFILPWRKSPDGNKKHDLYLIGTTDTNYSGDLNHVVPTKQDVEYLLAETNLLYKYHHDFRHPLAMDDVLYAYAGVRPLPDEKGKKPGQKTREHIIADHAKAQPYPAYNLPENPERISGLISIVGGKLTTYRSLGEDAVNHIAESYEPIIRPDGVRVVIDRNSQTKSMPLPGAAMPDGDKLYDDSKTDEKPWEQFRRYRNERADTIRQNYGLSLETARHLIDLYGVRYQLVLQILDPASGYWKKHLSELLSQQPFTVRTLQKMSRYPDRPEALVEQIKSAKIALLSSQLAADSPCIGAQVVYAIQNEFAKTLPDIMRRLGANWHHDLGLSEIRAVAEIAAPYLHWSPGQMKTQIRAYQNEVKARFIEWPDEEKQALVVMN